MKEGQQVDLIDVADAEIRELLARRRIPFAEMSRPGSDLVLLGVERIEDLDRLAELRASIARDGAVWVVAPKGGREPREAQVLEAGKRAGLVDVKVARFSETHTAHKFVIPRDQR